MENQELPVSSSRRTLTIHAHVPGVTTEFLIGLCQLFRDSLRSEDPFDYGQRPGEALDMLVWERVNEAKRFNEKVGEKIREIQQMIADCPGDTYVRV